MDDGSQSLKTVRRAFEVLDLLLELEGARASELAAYMDLPNSTVYDYLQSLVETQYVTREDKVYRPSTRFYTVAGKMKHRNRLFQIAKPEMKRLAAETGELVGLTVESEGRGIIFHEEEGDQALSLGTYPGAVVPLHTHATGKVILAYLPEAETTRIVDDEELVKRTENTISDPAALREELTRVREDGYAVDWDEQVLGMGMAAVPILVDERVLGSLGIVSPTGRMKEESYQRELLQKLRETVDAVTINYRYRD